MFKNKVMWVVGVVLAALMVGGGLYFTNSDGYGSSSDYTVGGY